MITIAKLDAGSHENDPKNFVLQITLDNEEKSQYTYNMQDGKLDIDGCEYEVGACFELVAALLALDRVCSQIDPVTGRRNLAIVREHGPTFKTQYNG